MQVKLKSLSKNEDFKFILNGKKISNRYSTIFYRRLENKSNRYFNISFITKKKIGTAVIRNKIKRRLRNMMNEALKKIKINLNLKDRKLLFLLAINLLPIFLILFTSMIMGSKIRTMWMTPFYLFFGTLLVYVFQKYIVKQNYKSFMISFLILFLLSPITYAYVSISETNKRTDYPGKEIANKVQLRWNEEFKKPINVILGNEWNAGNLSYHLKSRPVWDGEVDQNKLDTYNIYICIDSICLGNR